LVLHFISSICLVVLKKTTETSVLVSCTDTHLMVTFEEIVLIYLQNVL
jgi:hypothetical protein